MVKLLLVGVFEGLRELPKYRQALIHIHAGAMLLQEEIQPTGLGFVIEQKRRPQFALLEIPDPQNSWMLDALQYLEFPCRLPNQRFAGLGRSGRGIAVDSDSSQHSGGNMPTFPILMVITFRQASHQLIIAYLTVLVGGTDTGFHDRPA